MSVHNKLYRFKPKLAEAMRYETLVRVLDQIRTEAPEQQSSRYRPSEEDAEKVNQARSRAFIHLYLKVMFGLTNFGERERTITDGTADAGIDGYYIDTDTKTIHIIQSKFRTTEMNFEFKEIALDELLAMDINRVLDGEAKCRVPCDHVPLRSWPLFKARDTLRGVMELLRQEAAA